ncbi:MAG: nucleotidyltransferase domain-containing protein [Desulfuromonadaceae bacterium]|nr:nucleotidyltransferase domain-containing protein [Desulfuromonadaceae bacterium]
MNKEDIKERIVRALLPLEPEKVILFGSYAQNTQTDDSDVDLYIVSKEDFVPASYAQNIQHYKKYSRPLKELKQKVAVDLLIHTRAMNRIFESSGSSFSREILRSGERLL